MSRTQKLTIEQPDVNELWIPCNSCDKTTAHKVLSKIKVKDGDSTVDWYAEYSTIICNGCKLVSFLEESGSSEDYYCDEDGCEYYTTRKTYPERPITSRVLSNRFRLPVQIKKIFKETYEAVSRDQLILAGIGLRTIVEAVCNAQEVRGGNLEKKIKQLVPKGLITESSAKILHGIRLFGNSAAHEVKENSKHELLAALSIVEHMLEGLYLIPVQAKNLVKVYDEAESKKQKALEENEAKKKFNIDKQAAEKSAREKSDVGRIRISDNPQVHIPMGTPEVAKEIAG